MSQTVQNKNKTAARTPFEHLVKNRLTMFEFDNLADILGISPKMKTSYLKNPMNMPLNVFFEFGRILDKSLDELKPIINPEKPTT